MVSRGASGALMCVAAMCAILLWGCRSPETPEESAVAAPGRGVCGEVLRARSGNSLGGRDAVPGCVGGRTWIGGGPLTAL